MAAAAKYTPYPFPVSVGGCYYCGGQTSLRHCGYCMSEAQRADASSQYVSSAVDGRVCGSEMFNDVP
jgi:hypothetical protein